MAPRRLTVRERLHIIPVLLDRAIWQSQDAADRVTVYCPDTALIVGGFSIGFKAVLWSD